VCVCVISEINRAMRVILHTFLMITSEKAVISPLSSMDSGLEAFSRNPTHGGFSALRFEARAPPGGLQLALIECELRAHPPFTAAFALFQILTGGTLLQHEMHTVCKFELLSSTGSTVTLHARYII
jgi:hypothetical protein